jgi:hypothetical protein
LACTAHPQLRQVAPEVAARLPDELVPAPRRYLAVLHARNRDLPELLGSIARQLHMDNPASPSWTLELLMRRLWDAPGPPRTVLVDALDEANDSTTVMAGLLQLVESGVCRVVVGARPWERFAPLSEAARNQPGGVGLLDLDQVPPEVLRSDLAHYVAELLAESRHYRSNPDHRNAVAQTIATALTGLVERFGSEFLAAGLCADYIDHLPAPVADLDAVRELVPDGLEKLLELHLVQLSAGQVWLRPVLATLAHAKGTGMPRSLATTAAPAFAPPHPVLPEPDEVDVEGILNMAQFYLRRTVDHDGTVLYRLFHQAFDDWLHAHPIDPNQPAKDPTSDARRLLDRLLTHLRLPSAPSQQPILAWDRAEPYLLRHAMEHAADSDQVDRLLTDADFLRCADPDSVPGHLDGARAEPARLAAAVYRTSHHFHRDLPSRYRRDVLALDAARWGAHQLCRHLTRPPWTLRWATGGYLSTRYLATLPTDSRVSTIRVSNVRGRPIAITGNGRALEIWDLTWNTPLGEPISTHPGSTDPRMRWLIS